MGISVELNRAALDESLDVDKVINTNAGLIEQAFAQAGSGVTYETLIDSPNNVAVVDVEVATKVQDFANSSPGVNYSGAYLVGYLPIKFTGFFVQTARSDGVCFAGMAAILKDSDGYITIHFPFYSFEKYIGTARVFLIFNSEGPRPVMANSIAAAIDFSKTTLSSISGSVGYYTLEISV